MTTDKSGKKASELWEKLGAKFEALALEKVDNGMPDLAIKFAMCAETCWWHSTGEADLLNTKELVALLDGQDV